MSLVMIQKYNIHFDKTQHNTKHEEEKSSMKANITINGANSHQKC